MWKNEKGKGKARDSGRPLSKGNFNKTDFRKAMIAAWGESKSDNETEIPEEEETTNLCLMATHESKEEKSKGKQVNTSNSFSVHPSKLNKNKLMKLLKRHKLN